MKSASFTSFIESKLCAGLLACVLFFALAAVPASSAQADVRKADVVMGQTVETLGLTVAQCPTIDCEYAYVIDGEGTVYFERNATSPTPIASVTKVMTALTSLDYAEPDDKITVSDKASEIGESSAQLQKGDTLVYSEAMKAMMICSGNDAAQAIAESVGKTILESEGSDSSNTDECAKRFVQAMNDKASELGLIDSKFNNPHGLDDEEFAGDQHSCAQDVGTICSEAMKSQLFRDTVKMESADVKLERDGAQTTVKVDTTDILLGQTEGACGIKTGFTDSAGSCFAGAVNRDGKDLYAIVLKSTNESQRFFDAETLFDWVGEHSVDYKLAQSSEAIDMYLGNTGESVTVPVVAHVTHTGWMDKTVKATLSDFDQSVELFDLNGNVSQSAEFDKISGDVHVGDKVGTLTFKQHNEVIATATMIAAEDVAGPNLFEGIGIWWDRLFKSFNGAPTEAESVLVNTTPLLINKTATNVN